MAPESSTLLFSDAWLQRHAGPARRPGVRSSTFAVGAGKAAEPDLDFLPELDSERGQFLRLQAAGRREQESKARLSVRVSHADWRCQQRAIGALSPASEHTAAMPGDVSTVISSSWRQQAAAMRPPGLDHIPGIPGEPRPRGKGGPHSRGVEDAPAPESKAPSRGGVDDAAHANRGMAPAAARHCCCCCRHSCSGRHATPPAAAQSLLPQCPGEHTAPHSSHAQSLLHPEHAGAEFGQVWRMASPWPDSSRVLETPHKAVPLLRLKAEEQSECECSPSSSSEWGFCSPASTPCTSLTSSFVDRGQDVARRLPPASEGGRPETPSIVPRHTADSKTGGRVDMIGCLHMQNHLSRSRSMHFEGSPTLRSQNAQKDRGSAETKCTNFWDVATVCKERDSKEDALEGLTIVPILDNAETEVEEVLYALFFKSKPGVPILPGDECIRALFPRALQLASATKSLPQSLQTLLQEQEDFALSKTGGHSALHGGRRFEIPPSLGSLHREGSGLFDNFED